MPVIKKHSQEYQDKRVAFSVSQTDLDRIDNFRPKRISRSEYVRNIVLNAITDMEEEHDEA